MKLKRKNKFWGSVFVLLLCVGMFGFLAGEINPVYATVARYEYFNAGTGGGNPSFYGVNWMTESFSVNGTGHTVTSVKMLMYRYGSPGTLNASIRAVDSNGYSTGNDLTSGTTNANSFTTNANAAWYEVTLSPEYALNPNTVYALVCRVPSGDQYDLVCWRDNGGYAGGSEQTSGNSGSTWANSTGNDNGFEIWGNAAGGIVCNSFGTVNGLAGESCTFYVNWSSSYNLQGFIYGSNISGSFSNDTWTSSPTGWGSVGTQAWGNVTKSLTVNFRDVVQYEEWCNDTGGQWANSGLQSLSVSDSLINQLTKLVNLVNWNESDIRVALGGLQFNNQTVARLTTWAAGLAGYSALSAYTDLMKYGIEDQTVIKAALDSINIMGNGLPGDTPTAGGGNGFGVTDRYALNGFYWANKYNYDLSKWNVTTAYNSFKSAIDSATQPATLYVKSSGATYCYWGNGKPRYYDEAAETIDCFLRFYVIGNFSSALSEAQNTWNWLNQYDWINSPGFFDYYPGAGTGWECEAGGFLQIALKLQYYAPTTANISRTTTDMAYRFWYNEWNSYQWANSVVVHCNGGPGNDERRLQNTLMAWAALLGNYYWLDASAQTNIANLLTGYPFTSSYPSGSYNEPAWQMLFDISYLYNWTSHLFHFLADNSGGTIADSNEASAEACSLLLIEAIVPSTGSLCMPLSENRYEDTSALMDYDMLNLNISTRTLRVAIAKSGAISFQFNQSVTQNFVQTGLFDVVFAANWSAITSATHVSDLPTNRIYFATPSTVSLNTPLDGATVTGQNINFVYTPVVLDDNILNATLWTNATGSWAASQTNQTAVINNTQNTIVYTLSQGTYVWNVKVYNSTYGSFGPVNFTVIAQAPPPDYLTVSLSSPTDAYSQYSRSLSFVFTPVCIGNSIQNATLWTNATGSWAATQGNTTAVANGTQNTIPYTFSSNGTYIWNVQVYNSSMPSFASANYTLTLLYASLTLTLGTPANDSSQTTFPSTLTYTPIIVGDNLQNASLWVNASGTWQNVQDNSTAVANNTANSFSYTFPAYGTYVWNVRVFNSTASVFASANYTITIYQATITTTLNSPADGTSQTSFSATFTFTPICVGDSIQNATLWTNETGVWASTASNSTLTVNNTANSISYTFSTYGTFVWNVQVYNSTYGAFASANYTIIILNPTVTVSVQNPTNTTCTVSVVSVQFSASGGTIDMKWFNCKNGTDWIYGNNITYTSPTTMTGFANGTYTFYGWANNTYASIGQATVMFTVELPSVTVLVANPTNTTYTSDLIPIDFIASGGTVDMKWFNCKNGTAWIYPLNQTYLGGLVYVSDFVNGTSYTFYMFANNTVSAEDYATVMFSVAIYVAPSGGSTGGFPTNNTEPVNPEVPVEAAPDYTLLYIAAVGAGAVLLFGEEKKRKRKGLHAASLEMQNGVTRARNQKVKWKKEKVKKQNWRRGKPWD